MSRPIIKIHNIETNEVIEKEMTAAEFKIYEANQAIEAAKQAELQARAAQRQAIADRLGLTIEELKILLG